MKGKNKWIKVPRTNPNDYLMTQLSIPMNHTSFFNLKSLINKKINTCGVFVVFCRTKKEKRKECEVFWCVMCIWFGFVEMHRTKWFYISQGLPQDKTKWVMVVQVCYEWDKLKWDKGCKKQNSHLMCVCVGVDQVRQRGRDQK